MGDAAKPMWRRRFSIAVGQILLLGLLFSGLALVDGITHGMLPPRR